MFVIGQFRYVNLCRAKCVPEIDIYIGTRICYRFQQWGNEKYWNTGLILGTPGTVHPAQPITLQWRHNERDDVSYQLSLHCLLNCWFRCRSKKTAKLRVTRLCEGNSRVTGDFPTQKVSNAENASIRWRNHGMDADDMVTQWSLASAWMLLTVFWWNILVYASYG